MAVGDAMATVEEEVEAAVPFTVAIVAEVEGVAVAGVAVAVAAVAVEVQIFQVFGQS